MITVIERVFRGDPELFEEFKKAKRFWDDFFASHRRDNDNDLAAAIGSYHSSLLPQIHLKITPKIENQLRR